MLQSQTKGETPDRFGEMPLLVNINGIPFWQASGRTFPVVAGAEDPSPDDANNGDGKPPATDPPAATGDDDDFDKPRALATIRKLRENERTSKAELDALRKRVQEIDDKDKSESERLQARLSELERQNTDLERERQEMRNVRAVEKAAIKAGAAADPEDVYRLLDHSRFEHDDDGNLVNAEELVKTLLKDKPYLAGKSGPNGVPATPRSNGQASREDGVKNTEQKLIATRLYNPL